ncbi:hypothetical protein MLD38_036504 [Melastoma candidum]|nr:hypothetical protein MLD38_036504 [Melastoma candidum]
MRGKLNKKSDCRDTIRIVNLEVLERSDGPVVDLDVDNTTTCRETPAGNKRRNNLAQDKSVEEIEKFRSPEKSFLPHDKGKRICLDGGSGMIDLDVDEFETCDNLAQMLSKFRECIGPSHIDVLGESSKDAQGLRKLPPSIAGQPTNEESRRGDRSQVTVPPLPVSPAEDDVVHLASPKSNAPPPPNVKLRNLLKAMKMITGTRADTNEEAESLLDVAKRLGMNLPRPSWWPEEF